MKSNKLVLTCLVLVMIVVISEAGNVMKKHSRPSRPSQRRVSASRSNPDERRSVRTNDGHRRKPADAPVRSPSPGRSSSSGSRPRSSGTSSMRNSQPRFPRRKIPKIVITPPDDERAKTAAKPGQKKVTFSNPLENIKYIEPNPIRRRRPSGGPSRTSG